MFCVSLSFRGLSEWFHFVHLKSEIGEMFVNWASKGNPAHFNETLRTQMDKVLQGSGDVDLDGLLFDL